MFNMLLPILAIVIGLVGWSLHLMQQAVDRREFSLMLAGTLVAFAAAALVAVYSLMGNYIGYITHTAAYNGSDPLTANYMEPMESLDWISDWEAEYNAEVKHPQMAVILHP